MIFAVLSLDSLSSSVGTNEPRMTTSVLDAVFGNQWSRILIVSLLLLALAEAGFRLGLRPHQAKDEARRSQVGGVQGAVLGLLGLLIGFTFAMAASRYESRREIVLLVVVAGAGCFTGAYGSGARGVRSGFTSFLMPLLVATVVGLIFDLSHSRQGFI
jgi:hypothetical protein